MKKKIFVILSIVLVLLLVTIVLLYCKVKDKSQFMKPAFDEAVVLTIPESLKYEEKIINISDNYSVYLEPSPKIKDNYLYINFVVPNTNNVWIKVRVLKNDKVVAETGLLKPGNYLEKVKLNSKLNKGDNITYMVIGYEMESYLSAGTINLKTKVGE